MTGFGAAEGRVRDFRVAVEIRSVNHRFFNPSIKLPGAFSRWEAEVRELLRQRVARGHVTLSARIGRDAEGRALVDEARFAGYVDQLRSLQQRHALGGEIDVGTVLRMPDIFVAGEPMPDIESPAELLTIVEEAISALTRMREDEGGRLAADLRERVSTIAAAVSRIAERAPERVVEQRDRLRASVRELADGLAVDEQRLAQEIALLADRLDVSEEMARFGSHLTAFREALDEKDGEPVGKRLGFLLQELLRETNTTGSKANDVAILRDVVLIKEELERIREQVENLE